MILCELVLDAGEWQWVRKLSGMTDPIPRIGHDHRIAEVGAKPSELAYGQSSPSDSGISPDNRR